MAWITRYDFTEIYIKIFQRGLFYILSKFTFSKRKRTEITFDDINLESANWWIIPKVKKRWNEKISGDPEKSFVEYILQAHIIPLKKNVSILSVGCGGGWLELQLAASEHISNILGVDIASNQINAANQKAVISGVSSKCRFLVHSFDSNSRLGKFDLVIFYSSLHHFNDVDKIILNVKNHLLPGGLLIINEYVGPNRFQWTSDQVNTINELLLQIDKRYRQIFKTNLYKQSIGRPGTLRMIMNDPSEAPSSKDIIPVIHNEFEAIEEVGYGGNILMPLLKDISHHFINETAEANNILQTLFNAEDEFLVTNESDFVVGVYTSK